MLETEEYKGFTITTSIDEYPENPRDCDTLGTMVCFHNRYHLGDNTPDYKEENYTSWDELKKDILKREGNSIICPVYMYDHSGLAFSIEDFHNAALPQGHAQFDSGQIGFMFVSKKKIREEYGKAGKDEIKKAHDVLLAELEAYQKYANGEAYTFTVEDENGDVVDSATGFYDEDDALEEAKLSVDYIVKENERLRPTREREALEANGQTYLEF